MSSTRTVSRATSNSKPTSVNAHHTNGSANSYDVNDSNSNLSYSSGNKIECDPSVLRPSLIKNVSQYDGIYRNARFIHAISSGLVGQQVIVQTSDHERFHGVLETFSPNADIILTVSHRLDNNNNDIIASPTLPIDLIDTIDSSVQTFDLYKRIIKASNIVEIIAVDVDLSGGAKCLLDENPKVSQLEDDRFSRMQHFYGSEDIDPETLEDLDLGDDGKAGFDPEDMFHTNREKFNTTTDFDESKYTNVPVRPMSSTQLAEIEKKIQEIEKGSRTEDVDEDDAGVKRPLEAHHLHDGNSNTKSNRANRNDVVYDTEYNPSKRDNWREQRNPNYNNNNRRGSGGNNQRQNQYNSTNNRQQHNTRIARNNRFPDNQSQHEARDSPLQVTSEDGTRPHRLNSGNAPQGQASGPTSPSTAIPARTIYPSSNRPLGNRNSPAPYTDSSSSRNNSIPTTSSPPNQQSGTNKLPKKPLLNEQQSINDESDQPNPQRSSNAQSNTVTLNRPSQLQSKPQSSSTNTSVSPPTMLSNQDDNVSSHDTSNNNQSSTTGTTTPNSVKSNAALNPDADEFVPVFSHESSSRPESRGGSTASSMSMSAFVPHAHPQALHLLQQQQQQQQAQSQPTPTMIPATHAQNAAALYQQYYQTQYGNIPSFMSATPQQMTVGMMGQQMIQSQPLVATGLHTNNSNNGGSSGMTTPNSSVSGGPTYKTNNSSNGQTQGGDNGNNGVNNVAPKKAVVSVQRAEQSNVPQQQQQQQQPQIAGHPQMMYPAQPIRYYSPEYLGQPTTPTSMQLQQIPFYYHMNPAGLIQATANMGQPQNIMIPSTASSAGSANPGFPSIHYPGVYPDPRMYSLYSAAAAAAAMNPANASANWQLARSPPQQQQQQQQQPADQQRSYGNGQNVALQQTSSTGSSNTGGRPGSASGQAGVSNNGGSHPLTPHYTLNGAIPAGYAYGTPSGWIPGPQQAPSTQTNVPSQINNAYNVMFDPSQQILPPQATYVHPNAYDASVYFSQQSQQPQQQQQQQQPQSQPQPQQQQQQQQPQPPSLPQQGLDTVQGNYNR